MFLMFHLGRPDVLPVGDQGIRNAIKAQYRLRKLPDAERHGEDREALAALPDARVPVPLELSGQHARVTQEAPRGDREEPHAPAAHSDQARTARIRPVDAAADPVAARVGTA